MRERYIYAKILIAEVFCYRKNLKKSAAGVGDAISTRRKNNESHKQAS